MAKAIKDKIKDILADEKKLSEVAKVAFDNMDADHSGEINVSELENFMYQISNDIGDKPPTKEDIEEVLEYLDTDKSGIINLSKIKILVRDVFEAMLEDE